MASITIEYVEELAAQLSPADKRKLVERLSQPQVKSAQTVDLYGAWEGKFVEGFDLDAELKEIRQAWKKEWDGDVFEK